MIIRPYAQKWIVFLYGYPWRIVMDTKIKRWRDRTDLTQEEVAEAAGIPLSTYRKYEQGVTPAEKISSARMEATRSVLSQPTRERSALTGDGAHDRNGGAVTQPQRAGSIGKDSSPTLVMTLPLHDSDRSTAVRDREEMYRTYGDGAASRIEVYEIRSTALSGTGIEKGELVEVDTASGYVGPGPYLIRLDPDERPWPARLMKLGARRYRIETSNGEPVDIVKSEGAWHLDELGDPVDLDIIGPVERYSTRRFNMHS